MLEKKFLNSSTSIAQDNTNTLQLSGNFSKSFSSADRFVPTNRHNPCPVCDRDDGSCRIQGDLIHCFSHADARLKEVIGGYVCVKVANGHTATFCEIDPKFESQPKFAAVSRTRTTVAGSAEGNDQGLSLSLEERDQHNRKLLGLLDLTKADREHLRQRGLSDSQIDSGMYRSVLKYQNLDASFPPNLPGVTTAGFGKSRVIASGAGILCPISQNGLIIGFEIRLTHLIEGDKNRYRLLSSSKGCSIKFQDELPIPYIPASTEQKRVYVVEGKGMKPNVLHLRHNVPVIGFGRYMHRNPIQAEKLLGLLDKTCEIILSPDAGDILNKFLYEDWLNEYKFYQSKGFKVSFGWWNQATKDDRDIDNLETLEAIQLIDLERFQSLIEEHKVIIKQAYVEGKKSKDEENWQAASKFTPNITIDDDKQYFEFPDNLPKENVILSILSGMGTGKTEALIQEILSTETRTDKGVVLISYRNTLLKQTIQRAKEKGVSITLLKKINNEDVRALLESRSAHLGCCLDSIFKIDGQFAGRTIIIDESCSVLLHGITGGTLGNRQAEILAMFKNAIEQCERVILLDGNQNDFFTSTVAKLAPEKKLIKIYKKSSYVPQKFIFIEGVDEESKAVKHRDKSAAISFLAQFDGKSFIFSDSRMQTEILHKMLTKQGKRGNVLNQNTVTESWADLFLQNPDSFTLETQPNFHINSPTADSGLSVSIKDYFDAKFSFFNGVLTTNSQRQSLHRLRDTTLTHYISCPQRSQNHDLKIPFFYHDQAIKNALIERATTSALLATYAANCAESASEIMKRKLSEIKDDVFLEASLKIMALGNYERNNLRKCLIHSLKKDGHNVEILNLSTSLSTKDEVKKTKIEIVEEEAKNVFKAESLEDDELERYSKEVPNREIGFRVQKTRILKTLPGIETQDCFNEQFLIDYWVNRNNQKIWEHDQFVLFNDRDLAHKKHEISAFHTFTRKHFHLPTFIDYKPLRLEAMHDLNIEQFLDLDREWSKSSPEITALYEAIKSNKELQSRLNISLPKEESKDEHFIKTLKGILGWIGIKLKSTGRKLDSNGERVRFYQIDKDHYQSKERSAIIEALCRKHVEWLGSEKSDSDWIPDEKHIRILAEALKTSTDYQQVIDLENRWFSQKIDDPHKTGFENKIHNDRLDKIVAEAWALLSFEEELRIKSLKPLEDLNYLLKKIDAQIIKDRPKYDYDLLHAQEIGKLWGWRLKYAIDFGIPNARSVFDASYQRLGTLINKIVNDLPENAKFVYDQWLNQVIEHTAKLITAQPQPQPQPQPQITYEVDGKTYYEVNHRQVVIKIKPDMPTVTPENFEEIVDNYCNTPEDALKIIQEISNIDQPETNLLGKCLVKIGDSFRKQILDTNKYLHAELRKCYYTFFDCYINGIPIVEEI